MSYVNPNLNAKLVSLPIELKNEILFRDVPLDHLNDLIAVLEKIVEEGDS